MNCDKNDLLLYAVTDRHWLDGRRLIDVVRESLDGGVTMVQLREKTLEEGKFLEEAKELQTLCRERGVPFLVNDNVEIAREMNADGVHVGQSDMEPAMSVQSLARTRSSAFRHRPWNRPFSPSSAGQITSASAQSSTPVPRPDAEDVSHETLTAICNAVKIPVIAIGGITRDNVTELSGSGICGIAVISAIFCTERHCFRNEGSEKNRLCACWKTNNFT